MRRHPRIRVVIVPTSTYAFSSFGCDLHKITDRLNKCQDDYKFMVAATRKHHSRRVDPPKRAGLLLEKRQDLIHAAIRSAAPKPDAEKRNAVDTYLNVEDVLQQILDFASTWMHQTNQTLNERDLVIGIGGEVVVLDDPTNQFEGDAEADAFSSLTLGVDSEKIGDLNAFDDNNNPKPLQQACVISLRRVRVVFPEVLYTDNNERARAVLSRFIINIIAQHLGNRTFGRSIWHASMSGCVNETNWVGGARESYYVGDYCDACKEYYRDQHVARKYPYIDVESALSLIRSILKLPDAFDNSIKLAEKSRFWIEFAAVSVCVNITIASVLDLSIRRLDEERMPLFSIANVEVKTHLIAWAIAILAFVAASSFFTISYRRRRFLP
jgi:hypothetical protein